MGEREDEQPVNIPRGRVADGVGTLTARQFGGESCCLQRDACNTGQHIVCVRFSSNWAVEQLLVRAGACSTDQINYTNEGLSPSCEGCQSPVRKFNQEIDFLLSVVVHG